MATCEDYPCCGHEWGCCPDFDPETGEQLNMRCVCGAAVPLSSRSSLCAGCLRDPEDPSRAGLYPEEGNGECEECARLSKLSETDPEDSTGELADSYCGDCERCPDCCICHDGESVFASWE